MIYESIRLPKVLQLGHPAIDTQHEVLYVIYQELNHAIDRGEGHFELADVFAMLATYVDSHFSFEETLMDATRFSGEVHHVEEHQQLARQTQALGDRLVAARSDEERIQIARDTSTFLHQWLIHHISVVDRKLCQFLAERAGS